MPDNAMGKFLADLRKAKCYTQKDVADIINVSDKTVSKWERGDSSPDLALLPVLAELFNVTCDELLRGEKSAKSVPQAIIQKGEKQKKYLTAKLILKHKIISLICVGMSVSGLAMQYILGYLANSFWGNAFGFILHISAIIAAITAYFINSSSVGTEELADSERVSCTIYLLKTTIITSLILTFLLCVFGIPMYDCYFWLSLSIAMLFVWLIIASAIMIVIRNRVKNKYDIDIIRLKKRTK